MGFAGVSLDGHVARHRSVSGVEPEAGHAIVLREWLSDDERALAESYFRVLLAGHALEIEPGGHSWGLYGDPFADAMMMRAVAVVSKQAGRRVYPSYGYWRLYWPGATLPIHTDRAACDWTMSVSIANEPGLPAWGLETQVGSSKDSIVLRPGDAALFRGREIAHGRETPAPGWSVWLFLHCVDDRSKVFDHRVAPGLAVTSPLSH